MCTLISVVKYMRHSLNTKIINTLQLILQNGAGCCMFPCDVISVALYIVQSVQRRIHTNSGLHIKTCMQFFTRIIIVTSHEILGPNEVPGRN